MEIANIISLFFGCAVVLFSLATLLWAVYVYLRQQGYSCVCRQRCRTCLPCFGPRTAPRRFEEHFNVRHIRVRETLV